MRGGHHSHNHIVDGLAKSNAEKEEDRLEPEQPEAANFSVVEGFFYTCIFLLALLTPITASRGCKKVKVRLLGGSDKDKSHK